MIVERSGRRSRRQDTDERQCRQCRKHYVRLRRQLAILCAYRRSWCFNDRVTARASFSIQARRGFLGGLSRSVLRLAAAWRRSVAVWLAAGATAADAIRLPLRDGATGREVATRFFVAVSADTGRMRQSRQEKRRDKDCRKRLRASAHGNQLVQACEHRNGPLATTTLRQFYSFVSRRWMSIRDIGYESCPFLVLRPHATTGLKLQSGFILLPVFGACLPSNPANPVPLPLGMGCRFARQTAT